MAKKKAKSDPPRCMVCHLPGKHLCGYELVPLCGIHRNQLSKMCTWPGQLSTLSRVRIRQAFGFVFLDK